MKPEAEAAKPKCSSFGSQERPSNSKKNSAVGGGELIDDDDEPAASNKVIHVTVQNDSE